MPYCSTNVFDLAFEVDLDVVLARVFTFNLEPELSQTLQQIQAQVPNPDEDRERFDEWWQKEYQAWIEQLRAVRIPDFNVGQDGKLSQHLKNALKRYYEFNKYLIDRLNISCQVTSEVRAQIEDTLLLPIAEIENRNHR